MKLRVPVLLLSLFVSCTSSGCAEVDSQTEAVSGRSFLLGCISCKRREEVAASATLDWFFRPKGHASFDHIFHYDHPIADIVHQDFIGRLQWRGTLDRDIQVGAISLHNVTLNDTGTFRCVFERKLYLTDHLEHVTVEKEVELNVVPVANRELTAVIAEIMMFVVIVSLQLWLIAVLVFCYRKTWDEQEAREARKNLKAQAAALLESKDSCDGVQLE